MFLIFYCRSQAWADRGFCVEWAKDHLRDIAEDICTDPNTGVTDEWLLLADNLDGQVQADFIQTCKDVANAKVWFYPPNFTDDLAPVDAGLGQQIKFWFAHYLDEWLEDDNNIDLWESGQFPASQRRILVTHILTKAWQKVCSKPSCLRRYFTKTGCGMTATGEYDDLISPQRFKAGEYSFEYRPDEIDAQPAPQLRSAPEPPSPDDAVEETLGEAMLDELQEEDGDFDEEDGGDLDDDDDIYKLGDALVNARTTKNYVYVENPGAGEALPVGTAVVHLFTSGWERGTVHSMAKMSRNQKQAAEGMSMPTHVRYVLGGDFYLHDLASEDAEYISEVTFNDLLSGDVTEEDAGVGPGAWCIVKLE